MCISDWSSDVCSSDLVYPTVRNAFFPDEIYKATIANATRASLNGTDDVQGAELGFPFPIPKSGAEPIWNHKLEFRGSAVRRYNNQAIVKPDGSYKISKLDRKSTTSELQSLMRNSYAVFCLKKKKKH